MFCFNKRILQKQGKTLLIHITQKRFNNCTINWKKKVEQWRKPGCDFGRMCVNVTYVTYLVSTYNQSISFSLSHQVYFFRISVYTISPPLFSENMCFLKQINLQEVLLNVYSNTKYLLNICVAITSSQDGCLMTTISYWWTYTLVPFI